ncbi:MAG: right-handed parallel beta-helix repeat-containing protein [Bacteroidales bacterium]|nr:right-handed parallel beta-helix repeat-containing protein [Bacteroidales bacterium]
MKHLSPVLLVYVYMVIMSFAFTESQSQTSLVEGNAFLENQTNHDSIKVVFERVAPGVLFDSVYTDESGHFSKEISQGLYIVHYSIPGYISYTFDDEIPIYATTYLPQVNLEMAGIGGNIDGILEFGTYKVSSDLIVQDQHTLMIEPGTKLLFKENVRFIVKGNLSAIGSHDDSISFSAFGAEKWNGIRFYNTGESNTIGFAIIENSDSSGIRCINANATFHDVTIKNNSYQMGWFDNGGGGLSILNSDIELTNAHIHDNYSYFGGGIHCAYSNLSLFGSEISNNSCFYTAGGILSYYYSNVNLTNTIITNNVSINPEEKAAHGIYNDPECFINMHNCIVSNNQGDGIYAYKGNLKLYNCNLVQNLHHGINHYETDLSVTNSIISFNNDHGVHYSSSQISSLTFLNNNNVYGNGSANYYNCGEWYGINVTVNSNGDSCDAFNNLHLDPLYEDTANFNYHLLSVSPCIDAGVNDSVQIQFDLDLLNRIWDGNGDEIAIVDMGAYEHNSIPNEVDETTLANENKIHVYPNPAKDFLYVEPNQCCESVNIILFDISGQPVLNEKLKSISSQESVKLDISGLPDGLYFGRVIENGSAGCFKLIK